MLPRAATPLVGLGLLLGLGACAGSRSLDTSVGGRRMESTRATARKVEGQWWCEMPLPLGQWQVETAEGQAVELLPGEPGATLRWKVTPDRWSQQDRPFRFDLVSPSGLRLTYAVAYPNSLPNSDLLLDVFRILASKP